jgi:hypothetical protein
MYDYLEDILDEMPADMKGTAPTPASNDLSNVDVDSLSLNEKASDFFHRTTARLLFASIKRFILRDVVMLLLVLFGVLLLLLLLCLVPFYVQQLGVKT